MVLTLAVTVVWVVWGVMKEGYYMPEIATQFFIMGIVAGVIERDVPSERYEDE